jgi:hypothetical protein
LLPTAFTFLVTEKVEILPLLAVLLAIKSKDPNERAQFLMNLHFLAAPADKKVVVTSKVSIF